MKLFCYQIIAYIIIYIYIYNPAITFLSLSSIRLLYPIALIWLISHYKIVNYNLLFFKRELFILLLLFLYIFLQSLLGGDLSFLKDLILIIIDGFILSQFVIFIYNKFLARFNLDEILFKISCIAALVSLILILVPSLNDFAHANFSLIDTDSVFLLYRGFGIASGLTFDYAVIQGIALSYCLLNIHKAYKLFLILMLLISILFNARTGIIMPLITLSYLLFIKFKISYWAFIYLFIALVLGLHQTDFYYEYEQTFLWIEEGLYQISDTLFGTDYANISTADILIEDHTVYPNTLFEWIFGKGENIFNSTYSRSDIGYFIQLNYGGLLFILLYLILSFSLLLKVKCYIQKKYFYFIAFLLLTIIICNYKGTLCNSNGIIRLYLLLSVYSSLFKKNVIIK